MKVVHKASKIGTPILSLEKKPEQALIQMLKEVVHAKT